VKRFCNGFRQGALAGCTCANGVETLASLLTPPLTSAECPTISAPITNLDALVSMACSCPNNGSLTVGVTYPGDFVCSKLGQVAADRFLALNGDVMFAAAGGLGSASILYAAQKTNPPYVIGVDMDEYYTTFKNGTEPGKDRLLTSAMKRVDVAVFEAIKAAKEGKFVAGTKVLTAADDGIDLAPWHDAEADISAVDGLKELLSDALIQMKKGEIDTGVEASSGDLKAGKDKNP